nr:hypothetical protein [Tanacetum cinerariifolium]
LLRLTPPPGILDEYIAGEVTLGAESRGKVEVHRKAGKGWASFGGKFGDGYCLGGSLDHHLRRVEVPLTFPILTHVVSLPQLSLAVDYRRLPSLVIEKLYFSVAAGCSTREGNDYKLWYSETQISINGVGVILVSRLRHKVLHVRRSERIISISLVVDEETVNVISVYAPHVGPSEE